MAELTMRPGRMIRRPLLVFALTLLAAPSTARAQQIDNAAASTAGHMAFALDSRREMSMLRVVSPDGQVSAPEVVSERSVYPSVAVGARGDVLVGWIDDDAVPWVRYRPPGGPLGPPEQVGPDADVGAESLVLGVDGAGNAIVAWTPRSSPGGMHVRMRDAAGTWSPGQALGGSEIFGARLAVSDNGTAALTWRRHAGRGLNTSQLALSTRAPGGTFGPPTVIAGIARDADSAEVALNDRGDAVVAWIEVHRNKLHGDFDFSIHGRFRRAGGSFGAVERLSHIDAAGPTLAVLPDGRMILGWAEWTNRRVEARVRSASGRLGRPFVLTHDVGVNADPVALTTGRGAIAWIDRDPGVIHQRVAQATAGLRFEPPQLIARVRGWSQDPFFAATPTSLAVVPSPPLRAETPIRWQRVRLRAG